MAEMEDTRHIRIAGVAPAIVRTPLWLESEKRKMVLDDKGVEQSEWTTPEEVAEVVSPDLKITETVLTCVPTRCSRSASRTK